MDKKSLKVKIFLNFYGAYEKVSRGSELYTTFVFVRVCVCVCVCVCVFVLNQGYKKKKKKSKGKSAKLLCQINLVKIQKQLGEHGKNS